MVSQAPSLGGRNRGFSSGEMPIKANSFSRRRRGLSPLTSSMVMACVAVQPQAAAMPTRSAPRWVWLAWAPVSPYWPLSSTGDREVGGAGSGDGCKRAHPHQHLAIAGDDQHTAVWLRPGEAEANHRGSAHGAPQVEIERPVPGGGQVVGGGAEAGDDKHVGGIAEEFGDDGAAVELVIHFTNTLAPISRWENSTATEMALSKASAAEAATISATSSA